MRVRVSLLQLINKGELEDFVQLVLVLFFWKIGFGVEISSFGEMFGPAANTGHENSGVSGPVLIPMRFVWPYGGRRVFLSGSFTR